MILFLPQTFNGRHLACVIYKTLNYLKWEETFCTWKKVLKLCTSGGGKPNMINSALSWFTGSTGITIHSKYIFWWSQCVNVSWSLYEREAEKNKKQSEKIGERDKRTIRLHPTWWWGPQDPQASSSLKRVRGHIAPPYNPGSPSHEDFLCANTQIH